MILTQEQIKRRDELAVKASKEFFDNWKSNGAVYSFGFFEFAHLKGFLAGCEYEAGQAQDLVSALELIGDDEVWEKNNICPHEEARKALAKFRGEK